MVSTEEVVTPRSFRYFAVSAVGQSLTCTMSGGEPASARCLAISAAARERTAKRIALSG